MKMLRTLAHAVYLISCTTFPCLWTFCNKRQLLLQWQIFECEKNIYIFAKKHRTQKGNYFFFFFLCFCQCSLLLTFFLPWNKTTVTEECESLGCAYQKSLVRSHCSYFIAMDRSESPVNITSDSFLHVCLNVLRVLE